jgi:pimeloyl-ACP methyl ester carboxylesterase
VKINFSRLCVLCLSIILVACSPLPDKGEYFVSDDVKIHFYDVGEGPALILLHGFAMTGELQWGGMVDSLASNYRVIIPDHRGHGESDKPIGKSYYGRHMVDDVVRLMDYLEIQEARLAGMSMGGFMTVALTSLYPDRFSCGFVGAAGWRDLTQEDALLNEFDAKLFEKGEGFDVLNRRLNPERDTSGSNWIGKFFFNLVIGDQDPMVLASVYRGMSETIVRLEDIQASEVPMMTVIGDQDGLLVYAKSLEEVSNHHELLVLKGHDHGSIGGAKEFQLAMSGFIADEDQCGTSIRAAK